MGDYRSKFALLIQQMGMQCTQERLESATINALVQYLALLNHYLESFLSDKAEYLSTPRSIEEQMEAAALQVEIDLSIVDTRERINAQIARRVEQASQNKAEPELSKKPVLKPSAMSLGRSSTVHTNDAIKPVDKFKCLIDALHGRARHVAGQWQPNCARYVEAWGDLCAFYDDPEMQLEMIEQE